MLILPHIALTVCADDFLFVCFFCWQDELMASVCLLYTQVQNGLATAPQPAHHLTAGKLSKVCPHQVNTLPAHY